MRRIDALRAIDAVFAHDPLVVTLGATSRELASLGKRDSHLYLLDSMGLAPAVGAGLALAGRGGPVAAVEGDGSLLMGLSILPTLAYLAPPRFTLVVLDNHQHASAAGRPSQAERIDLAALCRGAGLATRQVADAVALEEALHEARAADGTSVVLGAIEPGNAPGTPFLLEDPVAIATRFTTFLNNEGER
ncbi:thiamine pyrophosphate-dependent enzyme [Conexibacter sp. CPCC 206217]|uniref:thiamine pyrophosphate-dependent enzyme n=1 Tax=Conexibacter sp. CPCC 206217 TaxID=3064574 RepID=UPI002725F385|nr:thiamine pyrophosphate-dependent enzyme [Conexibacter sp. CPCC 206217]MDO8212521.1 thiamine pyrophosphate-dependent enzyme [Conexibacter sp. CPCC 206217]